MNNIFLKDGLYFIVPLKCGYTAFCTAERRGDAVRVDTIPKGATCCAVVRDPVERVKSFFTDKLRVNVTPRVIQDAQRFVMNKCGLKDCLDLLTVSFSGFVVMLFSTPQSEWDSHLWRMSLWFYSHQFEHVINLSNPEHSDWLFNFLSIDREDPKQYNKTAWDVEILPRERDVIQAMYSADYAFLESHNSRQSLPRL